MCIHLLFDFWKLRNFRCFPFPKNSGTPTFPISRNSRLRSFLILVICLCISLFTCDSVVSPCFMLLFLFMYSGLFSVPGTYLSHSLVYKYLYSVAKTSELRLLLLSPISSFVLSLLLEILKISLPLAYSSSLLVTRFRIRNSHTLSHSEIRDP